MRNLCIILLKVRKERAKIRFSLACIRFYPDHFKTSLPLEIALPLVKIENVKLLICFLEASLSQYIYRKGALDVPLCGLSDFPTESQPFFQKLSARFPKSKHMERICSISLVQTNMCLPCSPARCIKSRSGL